MTADVSGSPAIPEWRSDLDTLAFRPAGQGGVRVVHRLVFRTLVLGLGYSAVGSPTGRLLRRSVHPEDRPALFAAQFALSHACWLLTYPLAGWLGARAGLPVSFAVLAAVAAASAAVAARLWPAHDPDTSRPIGRPVSESFLARGRPTNPTRIPVSPRGCRCETVPQVHRDLHPDHPHLAGAEPVAPGFRHAHALVIDTENQSWPGWHEAA